MIFQSHYNDDLFSFLKFKHLRSVAVDFHVLLPERPGVKQFCSTVGQLVTKQCTDVTVTILYDLFSYAPVLSDKCILHLHFQKTTVLETQIFSIIFFLQFKCLLIKCQSPG
ncbi:hypothetical protein ILYODFUR_017660 [Ilyodon furcidens]|uniref:Uncharacterized protein n=1 Tax=Ilyodon furcidens TaxID=33524 RepID=A0ABV0TY86_9TELE